MQVFFDTLLPKVQAMRDESATRAQDIFFQDGTVAFSKEQMMECVRAYDELIATIKNQAEIAEADLVGLQSY